MKQVWSSPVSDASHQWVPESKDSKPLDKWQPITSSVLCSVFCTVYARSGTEVRPGLSLCSTKPPSAEQRDPAVARASDRNIEAWTCQRPARHTTHSSTRVRLQLDSSPCSGSGSERRNVQLCRKKDEGRDGGRLENKTSRCREIKGLGTPD